MYWALGLILGVLLALAGHGLFFGVVFAACLVFGIARDAANESRENGSAEHNEMGR